MVQKDQQQPVFQRGEKDLLPVFCHGGAVGVHAHGAGRQHGGAPPGAPQDAADAREQLPRTEGLCDIVVRAQLQPGDDAELVARRTEEDHGALTALLDRRADGKAVAVVQPHVEKNEIKFRFLYRRQRLGLSGRRLHGEAL